MSDEVEQDLHNRTPTDIRDAAKELLKYGSLEKDKKPNLYRSAHLHQSALDTILEPLDFVTRLDEVRGLVFLAMLDERIGPDDLTEDASHPLVRRQRLNLEQSLLVSVLRRHFLVHEQNNGIGSGNARVSIDELISELELYFAPTGSQQRDENRVRTMLEQLRAHGIVTEPDDNDRVGVRPLIVHVADPDSLGRLVEHYRQLGTGHSTDMGLDPKA